MSNDYSNKGYDNIGSVMILEWYVFHIPVVWPKLQW